MRKIDTHKVNPCNDNLTILVLDEPGHGGACHEYEVRIEHPQGGSSAPCAKFAFQNGPINEVGVNGITQEVLLAIVQDRLESFQAGPYATEENKRALEAVKDAQHWLQYRTLKRMARGVEGTHAK